MDDNQQVLLRTTEGVSFHNRENIFVLPEVEMDATSEMFFMFLYREGIKLNRLSVRIPNNCHKPLQPQSHYTRPAFHVSQCRICKLPYQMGSSETKSPNNVVGKVTGLRAGHSGFESWHGLKIFLLQNVHIRCGPKQPPVRPVLSLGEEGEVEGALN